MSSDLISKLKNKVRDFTVVNLQNQTIGYADDIYTDKNGHVYLVVSRTSPSVENHTLLLNNKYIHQVDTEKQLILTNLSLTEIENLPVYQNRDKKLNNFLDYAKKVFLDQTSVLDNKKSNEFDVNPELQSLEIKNIKTSTDRKDKEVAEVLDEELISLLEERLTVNRSKRKVGEIVFRKEIVTRIVEVPVRREKLIVEQVSPEIKRLAEIDLGEGEVIGLTSTEVTNQKTPGSVSGEFLSPKVASEVLEKIALQGKHGCSKVRIELVLEDPKLQEIYQNMFDRCSGH